MSVTVAMAPNSCIQLDIPSNFDSDGAWSLHDDEAGTLNCANGGTPDPATNTCDADNGTRIYCHGDKVGIQKVVYSTAGGNYCICNIVTIVPHDHSDMYRGGPAFGVYKSD